MLPGQLRKIGPLVNLILQVLTLFFRIYQNVSCRCCGHARCSECYPMMPALSRKRREIGSHFKNRSPDKSLRWPTGFMHDSCKAKNHGLRSFASKLDR